MPLKTILVSNTIEREIYALLRTQIQELANEIYSDAKDVDLQLTLDNFTTRFIQPKLTLFLDDIRQTTEEILTRYCDVIKERKQAS